MDSYFLWASVGVLVFFLLIGFLCGIIRGIKRASLHFIFFVVSIVIAFCITKVVTNAILGITIDINGEALTISQYIVKLVSEQFNLSGYDTANQFITKLPMAILSPILFILLCLGCYLVFDIFYLIIARICFGKKKKDFKEHKPHRALGSLVGIVEGFVFLFILFAPLTALTKTYSEITVAAQTQSTQVLTVDNEDTSQNPDQQNKHLETISQMVKTNVPKEVDEALSAYNNSLLGKICGAGGLDKALFDGLSNFSLNGEKIQLRKELLNFASTYDNFVVVYNNYIDANYADIDLTKLKANIETFLNNGIFKTVVADTIQDLVVNFTPKEQDPANPQEPTLLEKIVTELKTKFSEESFKPAEYLKADILKIVDAADKVLKSDLISDINKLSKKNTAKIMEVVGQNNADAQILIDNLFDLNLVKDTFSVISQYLKDTLAEAGDLIAVSDLENTTTAWKNELSLLGDALQVLATNKITVKAEGETTEKQISYLEYVLDESENKPEDYMQTLFKEMLKEKTVEVEGVEQKVIPFAQLLDPVFESKMFSPLVNMVFEELDNAVAEMTGVTQKTNTTKLKETKTQTISALVEIMNFALNLEDVENLDLAQVGAVLDSLKTNAYNDGTKDGVFNETFVNMIWYLTGDSIDGRTIEGQPNKDAQTIKNYLAVEADDETANPKTYSGYYFKNYEKDMGDVQKLIDSTKALKNLGTPANPGDPATTPTESEIKQAVSDVVNVFADMEKPQQEAILQAAEDMLKGNATLTPEQLDDYKPMIDEKLAEMEDKISKDVADRLKQLLGYDVTAA